jgi:hypothetical protein
MSLKHRNCAEHPKLSKKNCLKKQIINLFSFYHKMSFSKYREQAVQILGLYYNYLRCRLLSE